MTAMSTGINVVFRANRPHSLLASTINLKLGFYVYSKIVSLYVRIFTQNYL